MSETVTKYDTSTEYSHANHAHRGYAVASTVTLAAGLVSLVAGYSLGFAGVLIKETKATAFSAALLHLSVGPASFLSILIVSMVVLAGVGGILIVTGIPILPLVYKDRQPQVLQINKFLPEDFCFKRAQGKKINSENNSIILEGSLEAYLYSGRYLSRYKGEVTIKVTKKDGKPVQFEFKRTDGTGAAWTLPVASARGGECTFALKKFLSQS